MQAGESTDLVAERPRFPLALAAAWIVAFSAVDWAASGTWRAEPAFLPVVAAIAWRYGIRSGLLLALLAAVAVTVVDLAFTPRPGAIALAWNIAATLCAYAVPAWLAAELGRSRRQLATVMTTDPESGLLNRSGLLARLTDELLRTERFGGDLSVLCIGLNGLARFEEQKGVEAAQRLVFGFSEALRVVARRTDTVARVGDEEFAVLLPGTGGATAQVVAERHLRVLGEWLQSQEPDLSCSIGQTTAPLGRKLGATALLGCAVADMQDRRPAPLRSTEPPAEQEAPPKGMLVAG
ncbi:MAG: GGDEF domain-containing protein [Steroidobacteraceae bacterium]|jgi:diguanylate cyclase (GGDEF)-like protein|nr:GGDEF domain-containing protein [Steroidobacteraceae bacterium]